MFHGGPGGPFGGGPPGGGRHRGGLDDEDEVLGKVYDSRVIARLPRYLAPVKTWLALGGAGMIMRALAQLAVPYLVAIATDEFILNGDFGGLNIIVIIFIAVILIMWAGEYMQIRFLSYAGQSVLYRMRTEMFDHLHRLSLGFFSSHLVGKLMSRVQNDVYQLQQLVTTEILSIFASIMTLIGIAVVMFTMNARLALLALSVVPVLVVMIFVWQRFARRAFSRVRRAIALVNTRLQEGISGVRVIQSLSQERRSFEEFDDVNQANLGANINAVRMQALMAPMTQIMSGVAFGLVLIFGGYQVLDGQMGPGFLIGFLLYIQNFFRPVFELTMLYAELQRAMASGSRIFELLDVEPEIKDVPGAVELPLLKGEVEFNHLSFAYKPGVEVLHDINLTISPGETVAIVGRTGAGKSSLMNLVARFYEASEGEVMVDGYNVASVTQQSLRRQIGIVPQDAFLFSGSIEDNIKYGRPEASHEEVITAARMAGIHDFITRLEDGYDTSVGERGGNLSAGQRQLVCLARAILPDPPILILDEATSNVDTNTERIMQESLRKLSRGRTCIIIAHRLSTVTNADRIVVLTWGRIAEIGSHRELLAKEGLYYQMYSALSKPEQVD